MITRRRLDFRRLARTLGLPLILLVLLSVSVFTAYSLGWRWLVVDDLALPLLGSAIALIVTFRNNASYDRWWEARTLWGSVVNNSRSFGRTMMTFTDDGAAQVRLIRCQIAYVLALRMALLVRPPWEHIGPYVSAEMLERLRGCSNVPAAIQAEIGRELGTLQQGGRMQVMGAVAVDTTLTALANAQGGLERIKRTPLPRQYIQFPRIFVLLYCLLLPFGLVEDLGLFVLAGAPVIGLMFLSLDRIGRDLEDPFEGSEHDTPMQAITRTVEIDLLQFTGAERVPEPVKPVDGVLW